MRKKCAGFTLLEILVVVGIIGIIAALAISNYLSAMQRAKQRRTMSDMRTVATAWEARAIELRSYNAAGFTFPAAPAAYDDLSVVLTPTYIKALPKNDAWGRAFTFATDRPMGATMPAITYAVRSAGRDGKLDGAYNSGPTTSFDCDIIYSGGAFVIYPEGVQQ